MCVLFPLLLLHLWLWCWAAPTSAAEPALCSGGPTRGTPRSSNVTDEKLCAMRCRADPECSSYLFKGIDDFLADDPNNEFSSNCVFKNRYEDMAHTEQQDVGDYKYMLGVKTSPGGDAAVAFVSADATELDPAANAAEHGFDVAIEVPSLKVTRYFAVVEESMTRLAAESKCADMGGVLALEYSQEVTDLITDALGYVPAQDRYPGLRVNIEGEVATPDRNVAVWQSGLPDWADDATGTCNRYGDWTASSWADLARHHHYAHLDLDGTGKFAPGKTPTNSGKPTVAVCQYIGGYNPAPAGTAHAKDEGGYIKENANDGDWNSPGSKFYHSISSDAWWAVDLGVSFAVKSFLVRARTECCGEVNKDLVFLVGDEAPAANTAGSNVVRSGYSLCAEYPYRLDSADLIGVTCRHFLVGKVALVINTDTNVMEVGEVGVFGMSVDQLGL